jgi:hypothetical protein
VGGVSPFALLADFAATEGALMQHETKAMREAAHAAYLTSAYGPRVAERTATATAQRIERLIRIVDGALETVAMCAPGNNPGSRRINRRNLEAARAWAHHREAEIHRPTGRRRRA